MSKHSCRLGPVFLLALLLGFLILPVFSRPSAVEAADICGPCLAFPGCQTISSFGGACPCPIPIPCSCTPGTDGGKVCVMSQTGKPIGAYNWLRATNQPACCEGEIGCIYECSFPVFDCDEICQLFQAYFQSVCAGIGGGNGPGRCIEFNAGVNGSSAKVKLCCPEGQVVTGCSPDSSFGGGNCNVIGGGDGPIIDGGALCSGAFMCDCPGVQISCGPGPVGSPTPTHTPTATATVTPTPVVPGPTPTATPTPGLGRDVYLRE